LAKNFFTETKIRYLLAKKQLQFSMNGKIEGVCFMQSSISIVCTQSVLYATENENPPAVEECRDESFGRSSSFDLFTVENGNLNDWILPFLGVYTDDSLI
jgi:hypothetical protein